MLTALATANPWAGLGAAVLTAGLVAGGWRVVVLRRRRRLEGRLAVVIKAGDTNIYVREPDPFSALVYKAFSEQHPGRLMFNPPDQMRLGHTERVEVRVTRTQGLDAELVEHLRGRGEPRLEEIPTAPLMAVTLKGDGFGITPYSDEEQIVNRGTVTTWEFDIRAERRGQQRLVLSVSLRVPVQGWSSQNRSIPVREVTIDVQVGVATLVSHFVSANWQWFIGTAIAIAAVVVAVLLH